MEQSRLLEAYSCLQLLTVRSSLLRNVTRPRIWRALVNTVRKQGLYFMWLVDWLVGWLVGWSVG